MFYQWTRNAFIFMAIALIALCFTLPSDAQLPSNPEETTLSIAINKIVDTTGWGGAVAVPYTLNDKVSGYFATAAQGGDLIRGRYHAEIGYAVGAIDAVLYTDGTYKGPDVANLGRQADLGVNLNTEVNGLEIGAGIFGRSGGAFAKPNAFDDLAAKGYDEAVLEGIPELASLNPAPTGLSFGDRNSVNLLVFGTVKGVGVKLMPELAGSGEGEAADQAILSYSTNYDLSEKVSIGLNGELGLQRFRESGEIERELAGLVSLNLSF